MDKKLTPLVLATWEAFWYNLQKRNFASKKNCREKRQTFYRSYWYFGHFLSSTSHLQTDRDPVSQSCAFSSLTQCSLSTISVTHTTVSIWRDPSRTRHLYKGLSPCFVHRIVVRNKRSCKLEIMPNIWVSTVSILRNSCFSPFAVCTEFQRGSTFSPRECNCNTFRAECSTLWLELTFIF
jgi:hypothetical protein